MTNQGEYTGLVTGLLLVGATSGIAVFGTASSSANAKGRTW